LARSNPIKHEVRGLCPDVEPVSLEYAISRFDRLMRKTYGWSDWNSAKEELGIEQMIIHIRAFALLKD